MAPVRYLGFSITFSDLNFSKVQDVFNEAGELQDDKMLGRVDGFLTELTWIAQTLKWGRENVPSKHHE